MPTRKDFEGRIIAKAWKDPEYREKLLKNPKEALQEELSTLDPDAKLPDDLNVKVLEETPDQYYLVLPRNPRDMSVSEAMGDDLDAIAPQTVAVVVAVVGIGVGVANTLGAVNNVGAANVGAAVNTAATVNVAATVNTV